MNVIKIFQKFPTQENCIMHLESARWHNKKAVCPYCFEREKIVKQKGEKRYHCNNCKSGFSVTVNTIFHDTKVPLQKWFLAIYLMLKAKNGISAKQLQRDILVTYKTAWNMAMRIRRAMIDNCSFLMGIIDIDETYIVRKPCKINKKEGGHNKRDRLVTERTVC